MGGLHGCNACVRSWLYQASGWRERAGALQWLLDKATAQEQKEMLLAYTFLWDGKEEPQPVARATAKSDVDAAIERFLMDDILQAESGNKEVWHCRMRSPARPAAPQNGLPVRGRAQRSGFTSTLARAPAEAVTLALVTNDPEVWTDSCCEGGRWDMFKAAGSVGNDGSLWCQGYGQQASMW